MPNLPLRRCAFSNCPEVVSPPERYCPDHKPVAEAQDRDRRGSSSQRGYTYQWQLARASFLRKNPLCVVCLQDGRVAPAAVVDHIIPHKGDPRLFWDRKNWQSLCDEHHNEKTTREGGFGNLYQPPGADPQGGR